MRNGTNTALSVTATPQKIWTGNPLEFGPCVQNIGTTDDLVYVWQGQGTPTGSEAAFVLQQYALFEFAMAQSQSIWVWASGTLPVPAVLNS